MSNFGTAGYGTYQSLLMLKKQLGQQPPPAIVVYGFIQHHEVRNTAGASWLKSVAIGSQRGHAAVPYASIDASGRLVPHAPVSYRVAPFSEYSALLTLAQDVFATHAFEREVDPRWLTQTLIRKMAHTTATHGADFLVVILSATPSPRRQYARFFRAARIPFADCVLPNLKALQLQGYGHPNGVANTRWASCIAKALRQQFRVQPGR